MVAGNILVELALGDAAAVTAAKPPFRRGFCKQLGSVVYASGHTVSLAGVLAIKGKWPFQLDKRVFLRNTQPEVPVFAVRERLIVHPAFAKYFRADQGGAGQYPAIEQKLVVDPAGESLVNALGKRGLIKAVVIGHNAVDRPDRGQTKTQADDQRGRGNVVVR